MNRHPKIKKNSGLFLSMLGIMSVPLLILGMILVYLGKQSVSEGMELEIRRSLAATAREAVAIFTLSYPGEFHVEDDRFYIGDRDLTNDHTLIDQIKENTGCELSLFYDNERMLTTIMDENGERIVHTSNQNSDIIQTIRMENEYYSDKVLINGSYYYGYYTPIKNGDEVCGMFFAGMSNTSVQQSMLTIVTKIIIVFLIALLVIVVIISAYVSNIVNRLNQIRSYISGLAENNFNGKMSKAVLERSDEIGDMGRHAQEVGQTLQTLIYKDSLTGLYNRRVGRIELSKYVEEAEHSNYRKHVTIALGDIDFFKKVNDSYGHECGDMVLTTISGILKNHMEKSGIPIRWGGEEFLLVLKTDYDTSLRLLRDILDEIRETPFQYEDKEFRVTMTFGITSYRAEETIEQVVKRADDLLYQGKSEGRNRIAEASDI